MSELQQLFLLAATEADAADWKSAIVIGVRHDGSTWAAVGGFDTPGDALRALQLGAQQLITRPAPSNDEHEHGG